MESQEVLENSTVMDACTSSCNGGALQDTDDVEQSENLGVDLLKDLDLYLEDIDDRLTISRMVSDSVIKGMICAVEQDASEKISQKDLELSRLKETLHLYHVGADDNESTRCSGMCDEPKSGRYGLNPSYSDALVEHDRLQGSLENLKITAKEQFKRLKKEIDKIKGSSSIRRKNSVSELVGLSGILQEKVPDKWIDVDRMLDCLRTTLDSVYKQAEDMACLSKSLLSEWQYEREFQAEIERMVIKNCIWSLQEEFELRLWDQNTRSCGNDNPSWFEKIKEISSLRKELDAISKSLSVPESGQLLAHGSLEHRKASGNHVSSTNSFLEGHGKHDESIITMPENLDLARLEHLSKDDLVNCFKIEMTKIKKDHEFEMTKMKRDHELEVQEMTEEYFSRKREKGFSLPVRKEKEFDILRKKIPEVILKLDDILVETEKFPEMSNNAENLENLKDRLESLCSENHQLKDLLADKKKEIKSLYSQVSNAAEKLSEHSLVEANLLTMIANLTCSTEDAHIEASISDDLYKFLLKELVGQIKCFIQESHMEHGIMVGIYEIIFREAADNAEPPSKLEIEDTDMESIIMQGVSEVFLREVLREAEEELNNLNMKYIEENEVRLSLEIEALEKEKSLKLNIAEKEKLGQEILLLKATIDEKDKMVQEATDALAKEMKKFGFASQELDNLRAQTSHQQMLISKGDEESQVIKGNLVEAIEKIELYKGGICKLQEELELATKNLRETAEEKSMLLAIFQEKQSFIETREREHRKQMDSIIVLVHGLSRAITDFECRAAEYVKKNNLRYLLLFF